MAFVHEGVNIHRNIQQMARSDHIHPEAIQAATIVKSFANGSGPECQKKTKII